MSMVNVLRRPLRLLMNSRLLLHRHQSQQMLDTLNEKKTLERESNDQLESVPLENTIDWNKKLKFHRMRGEEKIALKLFEIGVRKYQYQPDFITYVSMLEICKDIKDLDSGRYVHRLILKSSVRDNSRVHSLLMDMYIKCRDVNSALEIFKLLKHRTAVEYNALMTAYNANEHSARTIDLFNEMRDVAKIKPNNVSYFLYFQACIMLKSFEQGKAMHEELKQKVSTFMKNKELSNQVIALYIASGDYAVAQEIFQQVKEPNVQNYVGLMNHFNGEKNWERTIQLYDQMKAQPKIQADVATYLSVLQAVKETKNTDKAKQIEADLLKQNLWQSHDGIQKLLRETTKSVHQ